MLSVIALTGSRIAKYFVGLVDLGNALMIARLPTPAIGMVLFCQPVIGLLNVGLCSRLLQF